MDTWSVAEAVLTELTKGLKTEGLSGTEVAAAVLKATDATIKAACQKMHNHIPDSYASGDSAEAAVRAWGRESHQEEEAPVIPSFVTDWSHA